MNIRFPLLTRFAVFFVVLVGVVWPAFAGWPTAEIPICLTPSTQRYATVVPDGSGGVIVQWVVGTAELYGQRVDANGNVLWTPDGSYYRYVAGSEGAGTLSKVVADGLGGMVYAFIENGDVFASHVGPAGLEDWNIHPVYGFGQPVPICTTSLGVYDVRIADDGSGGAIVVWSDFRSGPSDRDIYAQRVDASGTTQWTIEGAPVCTGGGFFSGANDPDIAPDGAGGAFVSWTDDRDGSGEEVYVQHIDGSGSRLWGVAGVRVATTPNDNDLNRFSGIMTDGTGGAIVVYQIEPFSGVGSREAVARLDSAGTVLWRGRSTKPGAGSTFGWADYVATGDGGLVGVVVDSRDFATNGHDLYGVRLDANGNYVWSADSTGWAFCTEPGHQRYPVLVRGADGTLWAAWDDQRSGTWNLYYRQFTLNANPGAAAGDTLDINPVWYLGEHTLAALPNGNVVAAYGDSRNGNGDVFATMLSPVATGVRPISPPSASLSVNWPNPFGPRTHVSFSVESPGRVDLAVYDVKGRRVRTLVDREVGLGRHIATWDGMTDGGTRVASGVYFVRLQAGAAVMSRRVTLVR